MDVVGRVARQQWRRAAANARAVSRLRPRDEAAEHRDLLLLPPPPPDAENSSSVGRAVVMSRVQRIVGGVLVRVLAAA